MIEDLSSVGEEITVEAELAVIGAGPAGIVTALEAAQHGISVILLESGGRSFDPAVQDLSEAAEWDLKRHAPLSLSTRRQVGGTSNTWGGRCVPFDPVDFASRPYLDIPPWPIGYADLQHYFQRACDWMMCGRAAFNLAETPHLPGAIVPGFTDDGVLGSSLERWSLPTNYGRVYWKRLEQSVKVRLLTGVTCTEIMCPAEGGIARHLECRTNSRRPGPRHGESVRRRLRRSGEHPAADVLHRTRGGAIGQQGRSSRPLVYGPRRGLDR